MMINECTGRRRVVTNLESLSVGAMSVASLISQWQMARARTKPAGLLEQAVPFTYSARAIARAAAAKYPDQMH